MNNAFFASLLTLLLFSCGKEAPLVISADQSASVTEFMQEFDKMASNESALLRGKLLDFYAVATVNNCEIENFPDIITEEDVSNYVAGIGHSLRSIHDMSVAYGLVLTEILNENFSRERRDLIDELMTNQYAQLKGSANSCEIEMYTTFSTKSVELAHSFGDNFSQVSGSQTIEVLTIPEGNLIAIGGALNTFVRMQVLQDTCSRADDLTK